MRGGFLRLKTFATCRLLRWCRKNRPRRVVRRRVRKRSPRANTPSVKKSPTPYPTESVRFGRGGHSHLRRDCGLSRRRRCFGGGSYLHHFHAARIPGVNALSRVGSTAGEKGVQGARSFGDLSFHRRQLYAILSYHAREFEWPFPLHRGMGASHCGHCLRGLLGV